MVYVGERESADDEEFCRLSLAWQGGEFVGMA